MYFLLGLFVGFIIGVCTKVTPKQKATKIEIIADKPTLKENK